MDNFRENGRTFPWRETFDPYRIMVSEVMLQQTQTDRVVPKYNEWIRVFPDPQTLAAVPLSAVLEKWIGLGYNRRARFLQEACKSLVTEYDGQIPSDPEKLDALPGIGPYTARAISTFAFNLPQVFIETNIRAVYLFFFFSDQDQIHDREILELIQETLIIETPRDWYYALMDYGSMLKKKITNPNLKSRHYVKQSKFEGSIRQARGAIIRYLGAHAEGNLAEIAQETGIPRLRLTEAISKLCTDGLVCETEGTYSIS